MDFPVSASEERRIDASAVDQHQDVFGKLAAESANCDRPMIGINAGNLDSWNEPENFRDAGGPGAAYVVPGQHRNCRRGPPNLLGLLE